MKKLKVAQCWDDGVLTDLRLIEILQKYHAKATFNLNPGLCGEKRGKMIWNHDPAYPDWTHYGFRCGKIARNEIAGVYKGFQVASHCNFHQIAGILSDNDFLQAALDARHFLEDAVQHECTGFACPCGRHTAETRRLLREAGFSYGRTTENTDDVLSCTDPMVLASSCHFLNNDFYRKYEAAKKIGVFYFWGHSYETLNYERLWEQVEDKIRYIDEDPESEWIDVVDIVPLLRKENAPTSPRA